MFHNDDVVIMKGEHEDLVAVSHYLRLMGVACSAKRQKSGLYGFYSILQADKKQESKARVLANEYVASCNKMRVVELKVEEVFEKVEVVDEDVMC